MLLLFVGGNIWADEEPFYTLWTVSNTTGSNHTSYTDYFDDEHDGMTWNAPGNQKVNNTVMDRWRIGGKSLTEIDRTITAKTAMGSAIGRVVLNHFGTSKNEVTINSLKLTVASDVDYTTILDEVTLTPSISEGEAGSEEFVPSATYGTEWTTGAYYKLTINLSNSSNSNGGLDVASIQFFAPSGSVTVAKPSIEPNGGTFTEPQEVTITSSGNTVYYTLDGTDPTNESTLYTEPFVISEDCTVKAIAYDEDDNSSSIASATFTFFTPITTIGELCASASSTDTRVFVEFNDWVCTGVTSSNAFFTDGSNGILLYQSGHGFAVGDELEGSALITLTMYKGAPEIKGLSSTTSGLTVTQGAGAAPMTGLAIADLENNMQGCLIALEGLTYTDGKFIDDDDNEIVPYKAFITLPTLLEGKTYNVTGVFIWFDGTLEIAPRTAEEIQLITSQNAPISAWSVESETVDINDTPTATFTTDSDGEITYSSSDETIATIDENGVITPVGKGVVVITAEVSETNTYLPDSKSFTLTVTKDGYADATFAYSDNDIKGRGASDVGAEITATRDEVLTFYANRGYAKSGDTHIKIYGSDNKEGGNGPSFVQLSVVDGYAISQITLTATGKDNLQTWKDQFETGVYIEEPDSIKAIWTGLQNKVVLTNQAAKQARIKTIDVTYVKLVDAGKTVTIGETGYATFCGEADVVLSGADQFAIAGAIYGAEGPVLKVDTMGTAIPANTGVVLMGAPGEYRAYTHPDIVGPVPNGNFLTGVLEDTQAPEGSYVLREEAGIAGFYAVGNSEVTIPAGEAYLSIALSSAEPAYFFSEADYETGIETTDNRQRTTDDFIYNLAGQRMTKMQKGINIVGGKKVLK